MTLSGLGERGEACPPSAHPSELRSALSWWVVVGVQPGEALGSIT